jgi:hypothetical protein
MGAKGPDEDQRVSHGSSIDRYRGAQNLMLDAVLRFVEMNGIEPSAS